MKTSLQTICLVLLFVSLQSLPSNAQNIIRTYQTQTVHQRLLQENPDFKKNLSQMERQIAGYRMVGLPTETTIPVIFHIVYNNSIQQISAEQIYSQIAALNRDFGHESIQVNGLLAMDTLANFYKARPNQTGIRFCLGEVEGNTGINYISTTETNFGTDDAIKALRGVEPISPANYLNIWVGALADTVSGYAQMPSGNAATDGIVIDYRLLGTMGAALDATYNNGNTLTHLVGSYLGLYELWNELEPCGDDKVWDTPIHNAPNFGRIEHYRHVSLCDGNPTEMSVNFMDNTQGAYMFTKGQLRRMNAVLAPNGIRAGLNKGQTLCSDNALVELPVQNRSNLSTTTIADKQLQFSIQPNPVNHELNVTIQGTPANILVYSLSGKLRYQAENMQQLRLNVSQWTQGLYYVQVWKADQRLTKSFVIGR